MALIDKEIKAYNLFNESVSRNKDENLIIKDMMSNTAYIAWLIYFTQDKSSFSDEDLFYLKKDDPSKDYLKHFDLFYKGIEKYAKDNYIYSEFAEYGSFYRIKYDDVGFEIGILREQGIEYFCKRISLNTGKFIDFRDILNRKKQDNVLYIREKLFVFEDMIKAFYMSGVPVEVLVETFNNVISDIKTMDIKSKKRIKK